MDEISIELVEEFNDILRSEGSIIKLYKRGYSIDIKLLEDTFLIMEKQIINPSMDFYDKLERFFTEKNIKIKYNNMWSCFWSIN